MKIQRILQARQNYREGILDGGIALCFVRKGEHIEFVTWQYVIKEDTTQYYVSGHYFTTFDSAYNDFIKRNTDCPANEVVYCARQYGYAEIQWEELSN